MACNITDFPSYKMCQVCNRSTSDGGRGPWEAWEWLLTDRPGVFGLIGGAANPSGVALILALSVMAACSLPVVRKRGYFEVFYFSHLLYWSYVLLLILHAPEFWKWILVPLAVFVVEKAYRATANFAGRGRSVIVEGVTMASRSDACESRCMLTALNEAHFGYLLRVTKLEIKRPNNFKHSPGDWVFLRIPAIAKYEWHPFTISSAPEERDIITVHVR